MPASALMPANQPIFAKKSRPPMFIPSIMKKGAAAAAQQAEQQRPLPKPDQRFDLSLSSDDDNDTSPVKISPRPQPRSPAKSAKVQPPPPKPAHKHQRGKLHSGGVKPEAHKIAITKKKTPASKPVVVTSPRLLPKPDHKPVQQVQSRPEVNSLNNHA